MMVRTVLKLHSLSRDIQICKLLLDGSNVQLVLNNIIHRFIISITLVSYMTQLHNPFL